MPEIPIEGAQENQHISSDEAKLAMDIFESDTAFVILVPLAGIGLKDIKIHISEDVLSLSGERKKPEQVQDFVNKQYFLQECYWGKFSRSIVLPSVVSSADIRARSENGVLFITMPKARKVKEKEVTISEG